ncbi:MAG: MIP/aquaporin family protein [Planctomycetaceae bacterium]
MQGTGTFRESLAEFWGTFILMIFGLGVNAQVTLGNENFGDFFSINVGWGLAVTLGVYACAGISGAHINPAVTLALAVHRKFPWRKVLPYCLAQFAGAFVASVLVYVAYYEALDAFDGGTRAISGPMGTAGIWGTYPNEFLSTFPGGLIDQILGTALLVAMLFALADDRNLTPKANLTPVVVGMVVFMIGMSFGLNAGYAINPARDFSPRLFTAMAGWGSGVFTAGNHWWWVPVVGPCLGGIIGGALYDLLITRHHPDNEGIA